jgi:hypothetical protein
MSFRACAIVGGGVVFLVVPDPATPVAAITAPVTSEDATAAMRTLFMGWLSLA